MVEPNLNPNPNPNEPMKSRFPPLVPITVGKPLDRWPSIGPDDAVGKSYLAPASSSTAKGICGVGPRFWPDECSQISDRIFLGSDLMAKSRETLKSHSITHVLNCAGFFCPEYFPGDFAYKTLWLRDSPSEDIASLFYDVLDYFEEVRGAPGAHVFVHCHQGVSRSASFVIAYLMWRRGQSYDNALHDVRSARAAANPNMGFVCQLLQLQSIISVPNAAPLHMYRIAPHSAYDPLHLTPKAVHSPGWLAFDSRGAFLIRDAGSVYAWIGRDCPLAMRRAASRAADQLSRYETEKGPVFICQEGEEPTVLWNTFSSSLSSSFSPSLSEAEIPGVSSLETKRVADYDLDFDLFEIASLGGIFPPIPSVDARVSPHPIRIPTRESGWGCLQQEFSSASSRIKVFKAGQKSSCMEGPRPGEFDPVHHTADKARQDFSPCSMFSPTSVLNPPSTPRNSLPQKEPRESSNKNPLRPPPVRLPNQKLLGQYQSSNGHDAGSRGGAVVQRAGLTQSRASSMEWGEEEIGVNSRTKQKQKAHVWLCKGWAEEVGAETGEPLVTKKEDGED